MTNVSCIGTGYTEVQPKRKSVIGGTVKAGLLGGALYGTSALIGNRYAIKHPEFAKMAKKAILEFNKSNKICYLNKGLDRLTYLYNKHIFGMLQSAVKGKFNMKYISTNAGIGAGVFAGIYLAYRGIKALFSSNN